MLTMALSKQCLARNPFKLSAIVEESDKKEVLLRVVSFLMRVFSYSFRYPQ